MAVEALLRAAELEGEVQIGDIKGAEVWPTTPFSAAPQGSAFECGKNGQFLECLFGRPASTRYSNHYLDYSLSPHAPSE